VVAKPNRKNPSKNHILPKESKTKTTRQDHKDPTQPPRSRT
jgi:hypothetical protein